jgi:hypothetical protein
VTSPYRDELDALRERKDSLAAELSRLRARTAELDALRAKEAELAGELAGVERRIHERGATRRVLPMLEQVRVASPCNASWDEMVGDERVRFCLSCEKNVYNLSAMTIADAEALVQARLGGEVCVRFYRRADGTMMTADCPVGERRKRRKKVVLAIAGAGAMAAAAATAFTRPTCTNLGPIQGAMVEMGDMAIEEPPVPPVAPVPAKGDERPHPPARMGKMVVPPRTR